MNQKTLVLLVLALLVLLLVGCQANPFAPANPPPPPTCEELARQEESPNNLSFETIARESTATNEQDWSERKPGLFVAAVPQDIREIEKYIQETDATALQEVDFEKSVVVAAFSGWKSFAGFAFCVTSIQQESQTITLRAHLIQQVGPIPAIAASYYQLLQMPKSRVPKGEVFFHLALTRHEYVNPTGRQPVLEISGEEIVASVTHSFP